MSPFIHGAPIWNYHTRGLPRPLSLRTVKEWVLSENENLSYYGGGGAATNGEAAAGDTGRVVGMSYNEMIGK